MDSRERHELQQNDLAEFITHFGEFWKKWGNSILTVVLVVIIVVTAWQFVSNLRTRQHEDAWTDLAIETTPAGYAQIAETYSDPAVRALAYLRGGDAALAEAVGVGPAAAAATQPAQTEQSLELAASLYQQAIDAAPTTAYKLNALMGLANVAETRRNWDDARSLYGQVVELAGPGFANFSVRAQRRLELLPQLSEPVVFGPDAAHFSPGAPMDFDFSLPTTDGIDLTQPAPAAADEDAQPTDAAPATQPAGPAP